jgi:hypothetical protein
MKVPQLVRAGLLTAAIDGAFASAQTFFFGSTVTRLWQGVASVLLGPEAIGSGRRAVAIGLAMHVGVAFAWSTVFFVLLHAAPPLRRAVSTSRGIIAVASIFGPLIWMTMSLAVIPTLTGRPPSITSRWWLQFFGHIPFVALPIVATLAPHEADYRQHHRATD